MHEDDFFDYLSPKFKTQIMFQTQTHPETFTHKIKEVNEKKKITLVILPSEF